MKKFHLLVLGSRHVYGYGVADGESFVAQLSRRLVREGIDLMVECHAPLSLAMIATVLPRLPLRAYDLIVLQAGHDELQRPTVIRELFARRDASARCYQHLFNKAEADCLPSTHGLRWYHHLTDAIGLTVLRAVAGLAGLARLQQTRKDLRTILDGLQPYGHNVVLLTPFPHQDTISGWLRKQGRTLFVEEGNRAFIPVFDAHALLNMGDVCFLTNDPAHLNAVGHELLGSALYDFYRVGTSVVDDPSSFRRHK